MTTLKETAKSAGRLVRHAIGAALSPIRAGEQQTAGHAAALLAGQELNVESEAFGSMQPIPLRFSATDEGGNVSPPLRWSKPPAGTATLALIVEDPDAPMAKPFVHWLLWNLPAATTSIAPAVLTSANPPLAIGAVQGRNDAKTLGYFGPLPPVGHGVHHYHFQLFALDRSLPLGPDATRDALVDAMKGHVLAHGELVGTFER